MTKQGPVRDQAEHYLVGTGKKDHVEASHPLRNKKNI
jgi:hypothetical protein